MALFWRKPLKNNSFGQNSLAFVEFLQNCVLAKIALFWQNLPETVCLGQNGFILPMAGQNRGFGQLCFDKSCLKVSVLVNMD